MKKLLQSFLWLFMALLLAASALSCAPQDAASGGDATAVEGDLTDDGAPDAPESDSDAEPPVSPAPAPADPASPEPADILSKIGTPCLAMTEAFAIKSYTDNKGVHCRVVQGACTDGTYYYVALNDGQSSNAASISAIRKYNIATGALVATFENLQVAHCNDMTYNPTTNEIIAVHNAPERQILSVFDADSLEFKRKITIALEIYSIAYDPYEGCYWVGLSYGYDFAKLDLNFNQVGGTYTGYESGYTKQGMDVDSQYIYFVQYNKNCIIVYNKQGTFVRQIDLPRTSYEAENICHIGDTFYIGYYNTPAGGTVYKTELSSVTVEMNEFLMLERYTDGNENLCKMAQGSCTDGTYLYFAMNNDVSAGYVTALHKINLRTGEIVMTKEGLSTGLTNDMTYNSRTGQIIVVHNKPDATQLSVYDAVTLEYVETVTLAFSIYALAYDSVKDCYWAGLSGTYDIGCLDADFSRTAIYEGNNSGYTKQGMDCDGAYIYLIQSATNAVSIHKTDGSFVGTISLPKEANAAQSICHVGERFYIGYNISDAGGTLYAATITVHA